MIPSGPLVSMRALLDRAFWVALLCSTYGYRAMAQAPPCPDQAALKQTTERICSDALPVDGRVRYRMAQGGTCTCECTGLKSLTLAEVDSLRQVRAATYRANIRSFVQNMQGVIVHSGALPARSGSLSTFECDPGYEEWAPYLCFRGETTCFKDGRITDALEKIISSDLLADVDPEGFHVDYVTEHADCEDPWPGITSNMSFPTITVPSALVRNPAIGPEFALFILLHEIGHAVYSPGPSTPACESIADAWAISIGCNAIYGDDFGSGVTAILEQMEAYYDAIYASGSVGLPLLASGLDRTSADIHCFNEYPKLACRLDLLRRAAGADPSDDRSEMGTFVDAVIEDPKNGCWEGETDAYSLRSDRTILCGDDCIHPEKPLAGSLVPVPFGVIRDLLASIGWKAEKIRMAICKVCPTYCEEAALHHPLAGGPTCDDDLLRMTSWKLKEIIRELEDIEKKVEAPHRFK